MPQSPKAPSAFVGSSSAATTSVPKHLPTWAYDEYWGQGSNGTAAQAQAYLSYAEGGLGNSKAVADCHGSNACRSVFYFLDNFVFSNGTCTSTYASGLFANASESWYMHLRGYSDSAHRLVGQRQLKCKGVKAPQKVYALNNFNAGVRSYDQSYLRAHADAWDYYLMDETSGAVLTQFYGPGGGMCRQKPFPYLCTTTQEYASDPNVVQAHDMLYSNLTHSNGTPMNVFFNGVTFTGSNASDLSIIQGSKNVAGAMCEDCVVSLGKFRADMYASVLNAMLQMSKIPNASFIQLNIGTAPSGSAEEIAERTITAAMEWLGYSPGHTIVFPDLEANTKRLAIWPEYDIVPTSPLESMSSSFGDLQVSPRVYRREFSACYDRGVLIGPCAAIVNGQTSKTISVAASWLKQQYGHVILLSGGDIPSGGRVVLDTAAFRPASTTLAPGHAILLAR